MKIIYLRVFIIAMIFISCSNTKHVVLDENIKEQVVSYKIKKIINYCKLFDIIDVQRNDSVFRIISLKDTFGSNDKLLQVGKQYHLDLIQIYPNSLIERGIEKVEFGTIDGFFISFPKKNYRLYTAANLNGSFLAASSKDHTTLMDKFGIYTVFCDACKKNKLSVRLFIK